MYFIYIAICINHLVLVIVQFYLGTELLEERIHDLMHERKDGLLEWFQVARDADLLRLLGQVELLNVLLDGYEEAILFHLHAAH